MTHYDYLIVGSGAGGCAAAYRLAKAGRSVLLLEQGAPLPKDGSTLDVQAVLREARFIDREPWFDRRGRTILPQERINLGGKTKWYGAALLRFDPQEFEPDEAHQCLGWPISYRTLAPYYDEAERLLGVRGFPVEPDLRRIIDGLAQTDTGWHEKVLPMGLKPEIYDHPNEARHFDGFASVSGIKYDAEEAMLVPVRDLRNLEVRTGKQVLGLCAQLGRATRVTGVRCADGAEYYADTVLLAAGALHSPRLLQTYLDVNGLDTELPNYAQIGRHYKFHVLTALLAISRRPVTDRLRKTALLLHTDLPHSSVQNTGYVDGEIFAAAAPRATPRWFSEFLGRRAYGFWLTTEDGSHPDNRVIARINGIGRPQLDYDLRRLPTARDEHQRLVQTLRSQLRRMGYLSLVKTIPLTGSAHACGTLAAGADAARSVVDARGRVHGMDNLYVVDGSVLPRSSRVNPALTIYAWSLRVADLLINGGAA